MRIKKRTLQIAGGIFLLFVIVLVGALISSGSLSTTNASKVNQIAADIIDFDLPDSYVPSYGAQANGKSLVIYQQESGQARIVIMQDESQDLINEETMRSYLEEMGQDSGRLQEEEMLGTKGFELGVATTSGGFMVDGTPMLQTVVTFYGRKGGAFLSIESPVERWDVDVVQAFLDSLTRES